MIQVIYGPKGTGKTKRIIDMANESIKTVKGSIVFIDDDEKYMYDLRRRIRFIDASEYEIDSPKMFYGFICGIAAQDFDLEYIYIDGLLKIVRHDINTLAELFEHMERFADYRKLDIVMSISGDMNSMPEFLKKYII